MGEPSHAPGPRFRTPFGLLAVLRRDRLGFFMECTRRYGDVVEIRFPPLRNILVTHPRDVRHILHDNHRNYWKGDVLGRLKRIGGSGLLFSEGALWRRQRRLMQPAFRSDRLAGLATVTTERTAQMLDHWHTPASTAQPVDVAAEMSRLALDVVARTLFGTHLAADGDRFVGAVRAIMTYGDHVLNHLFAPPLAIPTPANVRARRAVAIIERILGDMIEARRRDPDSRPDLLTALVRARDVDTNDRMDDRQLRDECLTVLTAGHETTAVALAWTWYLLSEHPSVERRLHDELAAVVGDRVPTLGDLEHLPYTRQVVEESLRLYPPAWALPRQAYEDDEVGGYRVPAGTPVTLSPYLTHRHPAFWDRPDQFDPDRFTLERSAARPEYAYYPFGGGPRGCIGREFAMVEARLVLAMVAQRFRLVRVPGPAAVPHPVLTLRPRGGMLMTPRPRGARGWSGAPRL